MGHKLQNQIGEELTYKIKMCYTAASEKFEQRLLKINSKNIIWFTVCYKHIYVMQAILSLFLFERCCSTKVKW